MFKKIISKIKAFFKKEFVLLENDITEEMLALEFHVDMIISKLTGDLKTSIANLKVKTDKIVADAKAREIEIKSAVAKVDALVKKDVVEDTIAIKEQIAEIKTDI